MGVNTQEADIALAHYFDENNLPEHVSCQKKRKENEEGKGRDGKE